MIKKLKNISILIASVLLVACGAAEDATSGNNSVAPDNTSPIVKKISPNIITAAGGNPEVSVATTEITFEFSEVLDLNEASLAILNDSLNFVSPSGKVLKGTWDYNKQSLELTFTFDFNSLGTNTLALPNDESFSLNFKNVIKDLAGNTLDYPVTFNTPLTYDIELTVAGLPADKSMTIKIMDQSNPVNPIVTDLNVNGVTKINTSYPTNTLFTLSIANQPDADTFCAFSTASGKIVGRDAKTQINCSNVVPYVAEAANWNSYYPPTDANGNTTSAPYIHGGEQRKFTMSNLDNCDNLTIFDSLGAFSWDCKREASSDQVLKTVIYSTGLKPGKGLSDLLDFSRSTPGWLANSVNVSQNGSSNLNNTQAKTVWWNNPVVIPTNSSLSAVETIYIIPDNEPDVSLSYVIKGKHVALVIKPTVTLTTPFAGAAIEIKGTNDKDEVTNTGIWLEGTLNAGGSTTGVSVNNGYYTQIRNFEVRNATGDGIQILNSEQTYLYDIYSGFNDGNGISFLGNFALPAGLTRFGNIARNVFVNYNAENGILIHRSSTNNKLSRVNADHNNGSGIVMSLNNFLSDSQTTSNTGYGLVVDGQNNVVTMLSASANAIGGIFLTDSSGVAPRRNFLSSITSMDADNNGSGILFSPTISSADNETGTDIETPQQIADSNVFVNVLNESYGSTATSPNAYPTAFTTHRFFGHDTTITLLDNAVEPFGDNFGNDNGICEADEKCLFTLNIGYDQGQIDAHLTPVADDANVWSSSNIVLEEYTPDTPL